ncbi:MAG: DUF6084 family protein [Actinomycetota bacterium]|nr:DUF6084 family protein [Actinomycetota bacterium]
MPATLQQLAFDVRDVAPLDHAAAPTLRFVVGIEAAGDVRSIMLETQVQIAARRRPYDAAAAERLFALFGPPAGWGSALRTLLWTRVTTVVPPFSGRTEVELLVPCSYDLEVTASAYFSALESGEVPLELLFSGSVFYASDGGMLQIERLSWDHEAEYRLPVSVWRETMDRHFPGAAWLRLQRETFERLAAYRARNALSWDDAVERLLDG